VPKKVQDGLLDAAGMMNQHQCLVPFPIHLGPTLMQRKTTSDSRKKNGNGVTVEGGEEEEEMKRTLFPEIKTEVETETMLTQVTGEKIPLRLPLLAPKDLQIPHLEKETEPVQATSVTAAKPDNILISNFFTVVFSRPIIT